MSKTIGYIVFACVPLGQSTNGVLYNCSFATVFKTRPEAEKAIRRTLAYSDERGFEWKRTEYFIKRVTKP